MGWAIQFVQRRRTSLDIEPAGEERHCLSVQPERARRATLGA